MAEPPPKQSPKSEQGLSAFWAELKRRKVMRVAIQLIDADNENHLWANNFERELVDVFATQSELAKEISNSLDLEIQPEKD